MKDDIQIDIMLRNALSKTYTPSESLNQKIIEQVKEQRIMKKSKGRMPYLVAAVITIIALSTTIFAVYHFLPAKEVAENLGDDKLKGAFTQSEDCIQSQVWRDYEVALLGITSGENISDYPGSSWNVFPERTYAVVAVKSTNGENLNDKNFFISPLIQGLKPFQYNISTMNGSYDQKVIDGVLYRVIECDSIEAFADKELYLTALESAFYENNAYDYNEETGMITRNEAYENMNLLFKLPLDKSKANKEKADKYLEELEKSWNEDKTESKDEQSSFPNVEEVMEKATLVEDSVKIVTKNSDGMYEYKYGDGGCERSSKIFDDDKTGYLLSSFSKDGDGNQSYVIYHKDDKGVITGMVYEMKK